MSTIPTGPIDADPIDVYRSLTLAEVRGLLDEALAGIDLGTYDRRIVEWIKGGDQPTIVTLASLILRARRTGQPDPAGTAHRPEARALDSLNTL